MKLISYDELKSRGFRYLGVCSLDKDKLARYDTVLSFEAVLGKAMDEHAVLIYTDSEDTARRLCVMLARQGFATVRAGYGQKQARDMLVAASVLKPRRGMPVQMQTKDHELFYNRSTHNWYNATNGQRLQLPM